MIGARRSGSITPGVAERVCAVWMLSVWTPASAMASTSSASTDGAGPPSSTVQSYTSTHAPRPLWGTRLHAPAAGPSGSGSGWDTWSVATTTTPMATSAPTTSTASRRRRTRGVGAVGSAAASTAVSTPPPHHIRGEPASG